MKRICFFFIAASSLYILACERTKAEYIDLNTGKEVKLEKDENTGLMVDAETKQPIYIYVDTRSNDTIYGSTGKVINGQVVKIEDGSYKFRGEYEFKSEDGEYKKEVEKDGDIKIKDGDSKVKIDGETGEKKVKKDD